MRRSTITYAIIAAFLFLWIIVVKIILERPLR